MDDIRIHDEEQLSDKQCAVQQWLTNFKSTMPDAFALTILGKCKLEDVLRYMHYPGYYSYLWGPQFTHRIQLAIERIAKHYLIPFPEIAPPSQEEEELIKWLNNNYSKLIYRERVLYHPFTIRYLIQYLKRDAVIYNWNASVVVSYQKKYELLLVEDRYATVIWGKVKTLYFCK